MLLELRFRNFKCFRDEQVLSLLGNSDNSHQENIISTNYDPKIKVLKTIAIYGSNGSGKTKILDAFAFIDRMVSNSAKSEPDAAIQVEPFLFDIETSKKPSDFEVTFIQDDIRYQYGFSVNKNRIFDEWLYSWPNKRKTVLYTRTYSIQSDSYDYYFGPQFKGEKNKLIEITPPNSLILSMAATISNKQLIPIFNWFRKGLHGFKENNYPIELVEDVLKDEKIRKALLNLLHQADFNISELIFYEDNIVFPPEMPEKIRKMVLEFKGENKQLNLKVEHKFDTEESFYLEYDQESDGTQRFLEFGTLLLSALKKGKVIYIDELDSSLHTNLAVEIINMFHNTTNNINNVQLVFNTHDTNLLNPGLFRRDQIWFVEKDRQGASHIYSLAEYSPRKNENIEKGYLQGRYGAIPLIDSFDGLWDEENC